MRLVHGSQSRVGVVVQVNPFAGWQFRSTEYPIVNIVI